ELAAARMIDGRRVPGVVARTVERRYVIDEVEVLARRAHQEVALVAVDEKRGAVKLLERVRGWPPAHAALRGRCVGRGRVHARVEHADRVDARLHADGDRHEAAAHGDPLVRRQALCLRFRRRLGFRAQHDRHMAGPSALSRRGVDPRTLLAVGERVTVEAWPAKDGSRSLSARFAVKPSGERFDVADNWVGEMLDGSTSVELPTLLCERPAARSLVLGAFGTE